VSELKSLYDTTAQCNKCGFCTSFCPTYIATGSEAQSPRGRVQALRFMIENKSNPDDVSNIFSTCLLCGACTSVCFSEVPVARLMLHAREKASPRHWFLRFIFKWVLPSRKRFDIFLRLAAYSKKKGLSEFLFKKKFIREIYPALSRANNMIPQTPECFLTEKISKNKKEGMVSDTAYFFSCGTCYLRPSAGAGTWAITEKLGRPLTRVEHPCCGLLAASAGDLNAARTQAKRVIQAFEPSKNNEILLDDSSCASHLKEYPELFEPSDPWHSRALSLSKRIRDLSEFLLKLEDTLFSQLMMIPEQKTILTFHDPCKARFGQGIIDPPRKILSRLSGTEVVELPESDQCCGGGGTYTFIHPEIAEEVLKRKVENILSTKAGIVVSTSATCLNQIEHGLRQVGSQIKVLHLSELLEENLSSPS